MSYYNLEDLEVYQLSEEFSNEVWDVVTSWDYFAKDTIGKQLVRAADSISANIAEGYGRYHYKENRNFCFFSRGSVLETKGWLKKSFKRELINEVQFNLMFTKLQLIHQKLNGYIKFIGRQGITNEPMNQ